MQNSKYEKHMPSLTAYKKRIEQQLIDDCETIVDIIRTSVLQKTTADEPKAFFVKMIGDYYRYIAEIAQGAELIRTKEEARKSYVEADSIELPPCNPVRLGLVLNFSVFYYEILKNKQTAIEYADKALTVALERIDDLGEEDFREAKTVIELLKENLVQWKEEEGMVQNND